MLFELLGRTKFEIGPVSVCAGCSLGAAGGFPTDDFPDCDDCVVGIIVLNLPFIVFKHYLNFNL